MARRKRGQVLLMNGGVKALAGRNVKLEGETVIINIREKNGSRFIELSNTSSDKTYPPVIIPMIIQRYFQIEINRISSFCEKKEITPSDFENWSPGVAFASSYTSPHSKREYKFELIVTTTSIAVRITYTYVDIKSELFMNPESLTAFVNEYRDLVSKYPSQDAFEDQNLNLEEYFKAYWPNFYKENESYNPLITENVSKLYGYSEFQEYQKIPLKTIIKPAHKPLEYNNKSYSVSIMKGNEEFVKVDETTKTDGKKYSILLPLSDIDTFIAIVKKYKETYIINPPTGEPVTEKSKP